MTPRNAMPARTCRILVVEDEMLVAMLLEDMLQELGHDIAGVASGLEEAKQLAVNSDIDLAILDVHLSGNDVFPVADILKQRAIPFMFATGYGAKGLPESYRDFPTLQKPFQISDLQRMLNAVLAQNGK